LTASKRLQPHAAKLLTLNEALQIAANIKAAGAIGQNLVRYAFVRSG
jgi:hypothetical protein